MTYSEWVLKVYGIKVEKFEAILPSLFIGYTEYCKENDVKEEWHK